MCHLCCRLEMSLRGQMSFKYPVAWTHVKGFLELACLNSGPHMNKSFGMSQVLISGLCVKMCLFCPVSPCCLPCWIFNQFLVYVTVFKSLSLKIPNRGVGEDGSHQKNFYQSQETRHLVSPNQGTFIWAFCAFMQFSAPLAFDLCRPAPPPWQEAPWLYAEILGLANEGISSPKAPNLSGALRNGELISTASMLALLPALWALPAALLI